LLKSGQSLTPFVLGALLDLPSDTRPKEGVDRAFAFIRKNLQPSGALGMADRDIPDYPNYSTALAVIAFVKAGKQPDIAPMLAYLRTQQFTEQNGWRPNDAAYGGWGMGGDRRTPPDTGHVDLSMTRYVLDALHAGGIPASDPAFTAARIFVERCQNEDGGFYFTNTEVDTNKAGQDGKRYRSYGTTTADGVLALLATGHTLNDTQVLAAKKWLETNHRDMTVPGFVGEAYQRWPHGLMFYYVAAGAEAFHALHIDGGTTVAEGLRRTQRPDGSWANPENLVKEDDPLIATPFAIRALINP
jgi:hypothetical protein